MSQNIIPVNERFDLSEESRKLSPYILRKRRIEFATIVALFGLGIVFSTAYGPALARGSISIDRLTVLLAIIGLLIWTCALSLPGIVNSYLSAIQLLIDARGFSLLFPGGKSIRMEWSDPALEFELIDCTDVEPSKVLTGVPYMISTRGAVSLLSEGAFHALLTQVQTRGLIDSPRRGSRWIYTAGANPMIHHIRSVPSISPTPS